MSLWRAVGRVSSETTMFASLATAPSSPPTMPPSRLLDGWTAGAAAAGGATGDLSKLHPAAKAPVRSTTPRILTRRFVIETSVCRRAWPRVPRQGGNVFVVDATRRSTPSRGAPISRAKTGDTIALHGAPVIPITTGWWHGTRIVNKCDSSASLSELFGQRVCLTLVANRCLSS